MRKVFLPLAVLILLAAAALRLWQLSQYPPGPHYDEAANILITRSLAFGGADFFPIVNSYQGREALYYYLSAPLFQAIGDRIFTLRLSSVFLNLLTIAASMALGRAMFGGKRGLIIGLSVGVMMALSFPLLWISRQAFRAVTLPFMQSLALLFVWRGLNARRSGWRWLALGGLMAGAVVYTYSSSRLFPFWLILGGAALLIIDRANFRQRFRQGLVVLGSLALALLPITIYAAQHPDVFFQRLTEVTSGPETVTLAESTWRHIKMFFIEGEAYLRYNIPGRPYLTGIEGLLMLAGIAVALRRLFRSGHAGERAACWLALLSPLMVIPGVVAVGGLPPNHMRAIGMVPLIFVLAAIGFEFGFERILVRLKTTNPARVLAGVVTAVLVVGGALIWQAYADWAQRPDLFYEEDADLALAARWLPEHVHENTQVYAASRHYEHPTILAAWDKPVTWLGTDTLILPPEDQEALVIFAHNEPPPPDWAAWLAPYTVSDLPPGPDGGPAFTAYRLPGGIALPTLSPVPTLRNPFMTLISVDIPAITAGESGEIITAWRIDQPPPVGDITPLVLLEDTIGTVLDRTDIYLTGTDRWRTGEIILHRISIHVPVGTPPGRYPMRLTWVGRRDGQYISFIGKGGNLGQVWGEIGQVEVTRADHFPDASVLQMDIRQPVDAADGVRLLGWNLPVGTIRPGEAVTPRLFWQAIPTDGARPAVTAAAYLRGTNDTLLWTGEPAGGQHPSDRWIDGELLAAPQRWVVPHDQPAGQYTLVLEVSAASVELGTVEVAGVPRLFEPPPINHVLRARFGDPLELYGYSIDTSSGLSLTLAWHAVQGVSLDYTVFVHIVDKNGAIIDQRDIMPHDNTYPTSLWLEGEYVTDTIRFDTIAPEADHVRIGLYLQSTGERLTVTGAPGDSPGDYVQIGLLELEIEATTG